VNEKKAPGLVVIVNHFLLKRQVSGVKDDVVAVKADVQDVAHTVNSQHTDLKEELATVRMQNDALQDRLSALPPPESK
jgi:predicted extracellular nuclease